LSPGVRFDEIEESELLIFSGFGDLLLEYGLFVEITLLSSKGLGIWGLGPETEGGTG
jgi:hypothetical protein